MPAEYLPEVAWETIVKDVQVADATHYYVSVYPENPNDPGADLMAVTVGSYLKDWIGHTFKVVEVNIGGIPLRLRVEDSFSVGTGPQQGLTGIVYKSPTGSPFLAPIRHFRLDESALDYSRAIELDVQWNHRGIYGIGTGIDEVNLTKITLGAGLKFSDLLSTGWNGGKSVTIGVDDHNNLPGLQGIGPDLFHLMYEQYRGVSAGSGGYLPRYNVAGWLENSKLTDDGTTPKYNANTVWHAGNSNLSTVDWTVKDLTVVTAKIGSLSGYLKATSGVVGAVSSIPESDISFTDITIGDASINKHGYFPKLPTPTGKYLRDDLTWQTVSGGGVPSHNNLVGLQGIGPDYYHLMYEQYRGVSAGSGGYLPRYNVAGWLENSKFTDDGTTPKYNTNTIWHEGNDGTGSGLDADSLDGLHGSSYARNEYNNNLISAVNEFNFVNGAVNTDVYVNYSGVASTGIEKYLFQRGKADYTYADVLAKEFYAGGGSSKVFHQGNANLSTVDWTAKDLTVTTAKIGSLSGYLKGTAGVVGAVTTIPELDITPTAYSTLTVTSNATTWDCSTGLNKKLSSSGNFTLSLTNLVNGMSGDLRLDVTSTTTITLPTSKLNGSVTSLAAAIYHLCFVYDGSNLEFNIAKYV